MYINTLDLFFEYEELCDIAENDELLEWEDEEALDDLMEIINHFNGVDPEVTLVDGDHLEDYYFDVAQVRYSIKHYDTMMHYLKTVEWCGETYYYLPKNI